MSVKVFCDCCGSEGADRVDLTISTNHATKGRRPEARPDLCLSCTEKLLTAVGLIVKPAAERR